MCAPLSRDPSVRPSGRGAGARFFLRSQVLNALSKSSKRLHEPLQFCVQSSVLVLKPRLVEGLRLVDEFYDSAFHPVNRFREGIGE